MSTHLGDLVLHTHLALAAAPLRNAVPPPLHHNVEVHTVDTRRRVVLEPQVDVLIDSETEIAGGTAQKQAPWSAAAPPLSARHRRARGCPGPPPCMPMSTCQPN